LSEVNKYLVNFGNILV